MIDMKTLNRMSALLSIATVLLCLAGGCGNNSGKERMIDDTTTFQREPDVAEPIDTNMPGDIRDKTEKDSIQLAPPVP